MSSRLKEFVPYAPAASARGVVDEDLRRRGATEARNDRRGLEGLGASFCIIEREGSGLCKRGQTAPRYREGDLPEYAMWMLTVRCLGHATKRGPERDRSYRVRIVRSFIFFQQTRSCGKAG